MKATLEFNLPEDQSDFQIAATSMKWAISLWDLDNWLRNLIKHGDREELQIVRDKIYEIMDTNNINFDLMQ